MYRFRLYTFVVAPDAQETNRHCGQRNYGKKVCIVGFKCRYVSGDVKLSDEHNAYRWVDKNNYKEMDDGSDYFGALEKYFGNV